MKTKINFMMLTVAFLFTVSAFSQSILKGTVLEDGMPLPGANIVEKGTSNGTSSDFDGKFQLKTQSSSGTLEISYVGFNKMEIPFNGDKNLGNIVLKPSDNALDEVVIVGVADIAKERETPVAVSTIKTAEIIEKLGSQELPEILKATPSVYATKQGGGFGDSRINIRGFDQRNTAVMINGVPINDMENGWVYWSNWAGLSDVTSAMQVQRGLGSSKLAISSIGGTINVLTKTSNNPEGGTIASTVGNDQYAKALASYNTGVLDNGFSASVLLSSTSGNGYVNGTKFEGYNYFLALGYQSKKHDLQFTYTGAPQWHHQHSRAVSIKNYIKYNQNEDQDLYRRYNEQWGFLNGKEYSWRKNFYHKPVMSLNWEYELSDKSSLSSVVYGSWGRGGGSGPIGKYTYTDSKGDNKEYLDFNIPRTSDGLINFELIRQFNQGNATLSAKDRHDGTIYYFNATPNSDGKFVNSRSNGGFTRRASVNSHDWYGGIINFNTELTENLALDLGTDLRTYKGIHYRVVNDVLGADLYSATRDKNNPNRTITPNQFENVRPSWNPWVNIKDQEKIEYYNEGLVNWAGLFGQLEYKKDELSAFVQFSGSNQGFKRVDYFNEVPGEQETKWKNLLGGNIKGGANYNIDANNNFFVNAGYYSKQPLFDAVWINYGNNLNPNLKNEKIIGTEIGYGYRASGIRANLNLYRTSWKDRYISIKDELDVNNTPTNDEDDIRGTANLDGVQQVHMGVELDITANPIEKLTVNGMFSYGDWKYQGDVNANYVDQDQNVILGADNKTFEEKLYLDGVKVGDAAQITARLGLGYELVKNLTIDGSLFYADNLYAKIDPTDFNKEDHDGSLKLPAYKLVDGGISYKVLYDKTKNKSISLRLNVNNLFDEVYISESATNIHAKDGDKTWNGVNTNNRVFFGFGRTWNLGVRFSF